MMLPQMLLHLHIIEEIKTIDGSIFTALKRLALLGAAVFAAGFSANAQEKYIAEVFMTAATFCPRGSMEMDGKVMPISQYTALFSLLGTTYGGDGRTTFNLPDLRGRAPIHTGTGPGLTDKRQGQRGGTETGAAYEDGKEGVVLLPYLTMRFCIVTQGTYPARS